MIAERLGYQYGFARPGESGLFFGEDGVDFSIRIVCAGHNGRSTMVAKSPSVGFGMEQSFCQKGNEGS